MGLPFVFRGSGRPRFARHRPRFHRSRALYPPSPTIASQLASTTSPASTALSASSKRCV